MGILCALRRSPPEVDDSSTCYEECQMSHTSCHLPHHDRSAGGDVEHEVDSEDDGDNKSCGTSTTMMEDAEEQPIDNADDGEDARLCDSHEGALSSDEDALIVDRHDDAAVPPPSGAEASPTEDDERGLVVDADEYVLVGQPHPEQEPIPDLCCEAGDDDGAGASAAAEIDSAMDAALEDEEEDDHDDDMIQPTQSAFFVPGGRRYGGLLNLGNTCYMASALQMIATMEAFVESVRNQEPSRPDDEASLKLRGSFLDIMDRLKRGETVTPFRFKQVMDERSPLFVGFDQQDAHEFFTTLLDLIDEDFKKMPEPESKPSPEAEPERSDEIATEPPCVGEQGDLNASVHSVDGESHVKLEPDSSRKKARTGEWSDPHESQCNVSDVERSDDSAAASSPTSWLTTTCRNSFSELNLDEIGHLLHDTNPSGDDSLALSSAVEPFAPARYKLVGGRMNTADVVLTPYASAVFTDDAPSVNSVARDDADASSFAAPRAGPSAPAAHPSPVDKFFKLTARVRLTCDSCKYSRCHDESFLHLSLEIGPGCGSVDDGLRRFFSPEAREVKCEKCFSESATQSMEITELPKVLVLHFKRFIVEVSSDYSSVAYRKNQSAVSFDPDMSLDDAGAGSLLTEFLAHDCEPPARDRSSLSYRLRSVVNHMGASASCGHYTADACREYDGGDGRRWTRFNDSIVTSISAAEAIQHSQRTAYLALYELS